MLAARAILALALVGPEPLGPPDSGPRSGQAEQATLMQLVRQVVSPIAAATSTAELERRLQSVVTGPNFPRLLDEIVRLTLRHEELTKLPANLDAVLPLYEQAFGEAHRGRLRQLFDMSLELADRSATLLGPFGDDGGFGEAAIGKEIQRMQSEDAERMRYSESLVCGLVAAAAAEGGAELPESEQVRREILDRWFEGTKWILEATDPVQAALDEALDSIRGLPCAEHVLRLAYSRPYSSTGDRVLVVWFVFVDDIPDEALDLVSDPTAQYRIDSKIRELETEKDGPIYHRAILASEQGPVEDLLAYGA